MTKMKAEQVNVTALMESKGFTHGQTGGGCTAFCKDLLGFEVLITDFDATAPCKASDECCIGLYTEDGDHESWEAETAQEALELFDTVVTARIQEMATKAEYEKADFEAVSTGGGFWAYSCDNEGGGHVMISSQPDDVLPVTLGEPCSVVLYDEDGQQLNCWDAKCTDHALHIAKWGVIDYFGAMEEAVQEAEAGLAEVTPDTPVADENLSKLDYLKTLAALYKQANMADCDDDSWMAPRSTNTVCNPLYKAMYDIVANLEVMEDYMESGMDMSIIEDYLNTPAQLQDMCTDNGDCVVIFTIINCEEQLYHLIKDEFNVPATCVANCSQHYTDRIMTVEVEIKDREVALKCIVESLEAGSHITGA